MMELSGDERYKIIAEMYGDDFAETCRIAEENEWWELELEFVERFPPNPECGCITHEGPHWRYEDKLWHERNLAMLESGNARGFAVEEQMRLKEKLYHLKTKEQPVQAQLFVEPGE